MRSLSKHEVIFPLRPLGGEGQGEVGLATALCLPHPTSILSVPMGGEEEDHIGFSQLIIQGVSYWSTSMPKRFAQKVSAIGMITVAPPWDNPAKMRSASA